MARKILITGPTSGTGRYLSTVLADGNDLILVGRNRLKLEALKKEILRPGFSIDLFPADLSDFRQVEKTAELLGQKYERLDVFISNAGMLGTERPTHTSSGYELTFMTNYLAHYLLQSALLPALNHNGGIIFNMCSQSHEWYSLDFSDLQTTRNYQPMKAYGRSKCMLLMLGKWTHLQGFTTFNIDPGTFRSGIARSRGMWFQAMYNLAKYGMRGPRQAATDIVEILSTSHLPYSSGALIKNGKVKEYNYSAEEIGKLIAETSTLSGIDIARTAKELKQ